MQQLRLRFDKYLCRLEENAIETEKLRENVSLLQNELDEERVKLVDVLAKQTVQTIILYIYFKKIFL